MTLLEKARANRRAALASLNAHNENTENVVSLFDFEATRQSAQKQPEVPAFHSIRLQGDVVRLAA